MTKQYNLNQRELCQHVSVVIISFINIQINTLVKFNKMSIVAMHIVKS